MHINALVNYNSSQRVIPKRSSRRQRVHSVLPRAYCGKHRVCSPPLFDHLGVNRGVQTGFAARIGDPAKAVGQNPHRNIYQTAEKMGKTKYKRLRRAQAWRAPINSAPES